MLKLVGPSRLQKHSRQRGDKYYTTFMGDDSRYIKVYLLGSKNRTVKEMMNAMFISSGLSDNMWGKVVLSAGYILNRVP